MRRMYVTLFLILAAGLWALTAIGQKIVVQDDQSTERPKFDRMKRRMELREQMHRRMMEKLLNGTAADPNMFQDMERMFDEAMKDSFAGLDSIADVEPNFKSEWQESKTGRTLIVTPKKDQKLDIDVNADTVTIKGVSETKTSNGSYVSNFSNAFSVPEDCDGTKVKMNQKDGNILIEFPFKGGKTVTIQKPKDERRPLQPSEGDVEI